MDAPKPAQTKQVSKHQGKAVDKPVPPPSTSKAVHGSKQHKGRKEESEDEEEESDEDEQDDDQYHGGNVSQVCVLYSEELLIRI